MKESNGTCGQWIIFFAAMIICMLVTFGSNVFIGGATGGFVFIVLVILDSIEGNLVTMARIAEDQKKRAEVYDAKGEKVDAQA